MSNHNGVIRLLSSKPGHSFSDQEIRAVIWPEKPDLVSDNHIRQTIFIARKCLPEGTIIVRVHKHGYRYVKGEKNGRK